MKRIFIVPLYSRTKSSGKGGSSLANRSLGAKNCPSNNYKEEDNDSVSRESKTFVFPKEPLSRRLWKHGDTVPVSLPGKETDISWHDKFSPFTTVLGSLHCSFLWCCASCRVENSMHRFVCKRCFRSRKSRSHSIGFWKCTNCLNIHMVVYARCPICEISIIPSMYEQ